MKRGGYVPGIKESQSLTTGLGNFGDNDTASEITVSALASEPLKKCGEQFLHSKGKHRSNGRLCCYDN